MNRHALIASVGDASVYSSWLVNRPERQFDLLLVYYGDGPDFAQADADCYWRRPGYKFEHLHFLCQSHADLLERYDCIWCPDDDIALDTRSINLMFQLCKDYRLALAQPAIAWGDSTYASLRQEPGLLLRYSPFVEVMCPLFSRDGWRRVRHTFSMSRSSYGLDLLWPKFFRHQEMAILDRVGIHHTRPLGSGELYQKLARDGIDCRKEMESLIAAHGNFNWVQHRRLLRGRQRMQAISDRPPSWWWRFWKRLTA